MASEDGYVVRLRGLVVDFRIGVHPHEQGGAQRVRVDVVVDVARPQDEFCEDYRRVYCYERLAKGVRALAAAGHVRLVETRSEEHTSELQSLMRTSYAVFCLKKK